MNKIEHNAMAYNRDGYKRQVQLEIVSGVDLRDVVKPGPREVVRELGRIERKAVDLRDVVSPVRNHITLTFIREFKMRKNLKRQDAIDAFIGAGCTPKMARMICQGGYKYAQRGIETIKNEPRVKVDPVIELLKRAEIIKEI